MNAILPQTFRSFAIARGLPIPPELIVDGFSGGGGASEGIEEGFRRLRARGLLPPGHPGTVSIAINHDDAAIAMHAANHPDTLHVTHDIWRVNADLVTSGLPVGFMWASPDCRHHSKAKGGKPVSKSVRDLAWVVTYWAKRKRPRVIGLENVEEFRDWGPLLRVDEGVYKPDPARKGQTFDRWISSFVRLGYKVELRLLRGCDYGAPTIRKRLFILMRCDGDPIVWPEPTHGDPASAAVQSGRLKPWRVTAECIDWSLPCPSILMTKDEARTYTKATGVRLIRPLARNTLARIAKGVKRYVLDAAEPFIVTCNHSGDHYRGQSVSEPFATVTRARDAHGLVVPHLMTMRNAGKPFNGADEPAHTITAGGAGLSVVEAGIVPTGNGGDLAAVFLAQHNGDPRPDGSDGARPGRAIDEPFPTITTRATQAHEVAAFLAQNNTDVVGHDARSPLSTIVGKGSTQSVVAAHMLSLKGSERAAVAADAPHNTITARGGHSAVVTLPMLAAYYGNEQHGQGIDEPMRTISTKDRFGLVEGLAAAPPLTEAQREQARKVAAFLREFGCWDEREFVTVTVRGVEFVVVDLGMRMLTARELARAQGFPEGYVLAAPHKGGVLSDTEQRHKIGNSVNPDVAAAIFEANYRPRDVRWQPTQRAA